MITPTSPGDGVLAQALALVREGRAVFPVAGWDGEACTCKDGPLCERPGKHPVTQHGHRDASTDPLQLARWFTEAPGQPARNLALPCGQGLVVLDVDVATGGLVTLDEWETWTGTTLPPTLRCRTGGGGLHLYYRVPVDVRIRTRAAVLPGIDVRADGGYVVVPPSLHASGRPYVWEIPVLPVAHAPADLVAWLLAARGRASAGGGGTSRERPEYSYETALRDGCPAGARDDFLNELAFRLRKGGQHDLAGALNVVREHWARLEQPDGDVLAWEVAEEKVRRVWETVQPDSDAPGAGGASAWAAGMRERGAEHVGGASTGAAAPVVLGEDPEHQSDTGNANRLVRLVGDRLRHCAEEARWYIWDGSSLAQDLTQRALDLTRLVARDLRAQAASLPAEEGQRWARWALASEATARRISCLTAAAPRLAVVPDELDADPWLLVVANGTLDLRTGALRPSLPGDLNTLRAGVAWDEEADCPQWREHVAMLTAGDAELGRYLQRAVGYTLTGLVDEQKFWFLEGTGANGKNALLEPLVGVLGSYAMFGTSALLTGGDEQHATILADLRGKRLVFVDETRQGRALNVERVKMLTGSGRIRARRMRRDSVEFANRGKLWIVGNNQPTLRDASDGIWRRMQRLVVGHQIPEDRQVPGYARLLLHEEGAGILRWAVDGLASWREVGLGTPGRVKAAVTEYREEEDHVGIWLRERVQVEAAAWTSMAELYPDYLIWCGFAGVQPRERYSRVYLGRLLASHGHRSEVKREGNRTVRGYPGLRVTDGAY